MTINRDLTRHAGNKVSRSLDDVCQLGESIEEKLAIAIMGSGACIGQAIGYLRALVEKDGEHPLDAELANDVWEMIKPSAIRAARLFETEDEARADWETIAPEFRTQERLQQMLKMVRGRVEQ